MSKPTVSAAGGAMPAEGHKTRRAALGFLARSTARVSALACLPAAAMAAAPKGDDAEILALSAEVLRRCDAAEAFQALHIDPFNERFENIFRRADSSIPEEARMEAAWAYSRETGREGAIERLREFDEETDRVYSKMMAIPAATQPGRAAKVRALLAHVMGREWRGPDRELEWEVSKARALLGELAGMSAEELADV